MSEQVHHRTCTLCEALCGLTIETRNEDVLSIKGVILTIPWSQGFLCPKAVALQDLAKRSRPSENSLFGGLIKAGTHAVV